MVYNILSYGVIGLGFLLAYLAYMLLASEQKQRIVRSKILRAIYCFMGFSIVLCLIGFAAQILGPAHSGQPGVASSTPVSAREIQTNSYFVVVVSTPELTEAHKTERDLKNAGFAARILISTNGFLAVTVPASTHEAADGIRQNLIRKGLAKNDSFVSPGLTLKEILSP